MTFRVRHELLWKHFLIESALLFRLMCNRASSGHGMPEPQSPVAEVVREQIAFRAAHKCIAGSCIPTHQQKLKRTTECVLCVA